MKTKNEDGVENMCQNTSKEWNSIENYGLNPRPWHQIVDP